MNNIAYYNGTYAPLEELTIPALDRAVYFGDGVYEAAYFRNGRPFALDDHLKRFKNSLGFVKIAYPTESEEELEKILRGLCDKIGGEGIVYWQTSRATAPRNHAFPENAKSNLLAWAKHKPLGDFTAPIKLMTMDDIRYKMCNVKTLNLMPNIMASQAAKESGCDEAVFVRDGLVTEGSHSNIHIIKDKKIITHENGSLILPGTVRSHLLRVAEKLGIAYEERPFAPEEMYTADEVLVTSATTFFRHACELNGRAVGMRDNETYMQLVGEYMQWMERETE